MHVLNRMQPIGELEFMESFQDTNLKVHAVCNVVSRWVWGKEILLQSVSFVSNSQHTGSLATVSQSQASSGRHPYALGRFNVYTTTVVSLLYIIISWAKWGPMNRSVGHPLQFQFVPGCLLPQRWIAGTAEYHSLFIRSVQTSVDMVYKQRKSEGSNLQQKVRMTWHQRSRHVCSFQYSLFTSQTTCNILHFWSPPEISFDYSPSFFNDATCGVEA